MTIDYAGKSAGPTVGYRLCRKICRSNGWFAPHSGVGQALDEVNSRIRAAERRERKAEWLGNDNRKTMIKVETIG